VQSGGSICREAGYEGAGTVEYLVGEDGTVSFLEVNTASRWTPGDRGDTGLDLVAEQFRIAAGNHWC